MTSESLHIRTGDGDITTVEVRGMDMREWHAFYTSCPDSIKTGGPVDREGFEWAAEVATATTKYSSQEIDNMPSSAVVQICQRAMNLSAENVGSVLPVGEWVVVS